MEEGYGEEKSRPAWSQDYVVTVQDGRTLMVRRLISMDFSGTASHCAVDTMMDK